MNRRFGAALAFLVILAVGCQGSGFQYVTDSDSSTYFKLPEDWKLFEEDASSVYTTYFVAFDGSPEPSAENLLSSDAQHPFGLAQVRVLTNQQKSEWSLTTMRNFDLPVDQLVQQERAEIIFEDDDLVLNSGVRGLRVVYNVRQEDGMMTINQTSLVDPTTRFFYQFMIGCEVDCYRRNQDTIDDVVNSWTIEER